MRSRIRKFTAKLSDDLVLECKGAMLYRDMDFSKLPVTCSRLGRRKKESMNLRRSTSRTIGPKQQTRATVSRRVVMGQQIAKEKVLG